MDDFIRTTGELGVSTGTIGEKIQGPAGQE
jgi:hypothetical protein